MATFAGVMSSAKQKWDSSGANEAFAKASAAVPQGTKDYISTASGQVFNRQKLRGVSVFFGIGDERPFYIEKNPSLLVARVKHNVSFFYLNYIALCGVLFCLTLLVSPSSIIGIGLLGALWLYVIKATADGPIVISGISISPRNANIAAGAFSAVVLFWLLSGIFWWSLATSGFFTGLHAVFRDASMHQDTEDQVDMVGEVTGESAAFLGDV